MIIREVSDGALTQCMYHGSYATLVADLIYTIYSNIQFDQLIALCVAHYSRKWRPTTSTTTTV